MKEHLKDPPRKVIYLNVSSQKNNLNFERINKNNEIHQNRKEDKNCSSFFEVSKAKDINHNEHLEKEQLVKNSLQEISFQNKRAFTSSQNKECLTEISETDTLIKKYLEESTILKDNYVAIQYKMKEYENQLKEKDDIIRRWTTHSAYLERELNNSRLHINKIGKHEIKGLNKSDNFLINQEKKKNITNVETAKKKINYEELEPSVTFKQKINLQNKIDSQIKIREIKEVATKTITKEEGNKQDTEEYKKIILLNNELKNEKTLRRFKEKEITDLYKIIENKNKELLRYEKERTFYFQKNSKHEATENKSHFLRFLAEQSNENETDE